MFRCGLGRPAAVVRCLLTGIRPHGFSPWGWYALSMRTGTGSGGGRDDAPDDDDRSPADDSIAVTAASMLARLAAGEDAAEMVRDGVDDLAPPHVDGGDIDTLVSIAATGGIQLAQQSRRFNARAGADNRGPRVPIVTREIEHPDGTTVGLRLRIDSTDVSIETDADGVGVLTADGETPIKAFTTPFTPHETAIERSDGHTEVVVKAAPMIGGPDPDPDVGGDADADG